MSESAHPADSRFDFWRRRIGLVAGPTVGLIVYWLVQPLDLSPQAKPLAGILAFTVIYWVCEPVPLAATALTSPLLCVVCGVGETKHIFASFASSILFLFIGMFILAEAASKHGLDKRFALWVLGCRGVARSPVTLLLAVGAVAGFISMWTSNTATTAVIVPVVLGMVRAYPQFAEPRMAASLLLMVSFAATAGGLATPIGTPPNLIAVGFIDELLHVRVDFLSWMKLGVPLSIVLILLLGLLLKPRGVGRFQNHGDLTADFRRQRRLLGPMSLGERNVVLVFLAALCCWLYPSIAGEMRGPRAPEVTWFRTHLPEDLIGLGAGLLLFVLPTNLRKGEFTVTWRDAAKIDWGTILLFGGGMALGQQIFATGLAKELSDAVIGIFGTPTLWTLAGAGIVLSIALSEFTSNTASVNVMAPLLIGLAQASNLAPVPVAIATALACSFGFMLPVSTAPNAIAYATGRITVLEMARTGIVFDVLGFALIFAALRIVCPLFGWA